MRRVVDTNVAVVANGRNSNATVECRLSTIKALNVLLTTGSVVIDAEGDIVREYRQQLNPSGQPGVGDRFFQMLLTEYSGRVERVQLSKDLNGSYVDFPEDPDLAGFDPSDKKFVAVSLRSQVPVINAVDGDWLEYQVPLNRNGVAIEFLCGCNKETWFRSEG